MNAPFIWILSPGILAVLLLLFRHRVRMNAVLGTIAALALALLAWFVPIGQAQTIGPVTVTIAQTLSVLGRRFELMPSDAPALVMIYLGVAFWFGGIWVARCGSLFAPVGLGMAALLTAVLAVEPFLYAAILLELVVLVSVPLLARPGRPIGRGVLRFLTFQTFGMPFLLFTGWILEGTEAAPSDPVLLGLVSVLLALGFAFTIGLIPFHTWLPMLAEETHPYVVAFVFYILTLVITLFGIGFLDRYPWLRSMPGLAELLLWAGVVMVLVGGFWAAYQRHLGRIMGFAVMMEIGLSLLAVSAGLSSQNLPVVFGLLFAILLPRGLSLGVWALGLVVIQKNAEKSADPRENLRYRHVQGAARRSPVAAAALLLANFSLAGFPLLAGFPVRMALWNGLTDQARTVVVLAFIGSAGLLVGGLRTLTVLVMGVKEETWQVTETKSELALLIVGILAMILVGFLPDLFNPALIRMTEAFTTLR